LIFDSTTHFLQSEIRPVFRSFRKCLVKSNLGAIISPRGEKCGPDLLSEYLQGRTQSVDLNQ
ncbi:MAG: hypothetical protein ACR2RB_00790, partial [Gammaproteobacteria bacterium]